MRPPGVLPSAAFRFTMSARRPAHQMQLRKQRAWPAPPMPLLKPLLPASSTGNNHPSNGGAGVHEDTLILKKSTLKKSMAGPWSDAIGHGTRPASFLPYES